MDMAVVAFVTGLLHQAMERPAVTRGGGQTLTCLAFTERDLRQQGAQPKQHAAGCVNLLTGEIVGFIQTRKGGVRCPVTGFTDGTCYAVTGCTSLHGCL